jgi:curved DNA-binding protein CbpA
LGESEKPKSKRTQETAVLYTHYDYLELPPGASCARIEAAYQVVKQRLEEISDETLVRLIHEAYSVLSDPTRRTDYDADLQRAANEADAELKASLDQRGGVSRRHVQEIPAPLRVAMSAWAA